MADDSSINLGVADYLANPSQPVAPRLKDSLLYGVQQQPDLQAKMRQYARGLGVPLPAALGDAEFVQQHGHVQSLDPNGMVLGAPKTANWLAEPDNAAVAHDDIDVMKGLEQTLHNLGQIGKGSAWSVLGSFYGGVQALNEAIDPFGQMGLAQKRELDPRTGKFTVTGAETQVQALARQDTATGNAAMPTTENWMQAGVNAGVASLLQNAPGVMLALATRNPELGLAAMGLQTGGGAYAEARGAGLDPAKAAIHAAEQGGVEVLTEKLPMEHLLGDMKAGSGVVKTWLHQLATDVPGEITATMLQDYADWANLHPDKPFMDYVRSRPEALGETVIATMMGTAGHTAMQQVAQAAQTHLAKSQAGQQQAQQAAQTQAVFENLAKAAEASALRQRDPQTFHDYVAAVTQDTPVDRVYVNAQDMVDVLAQGSPDKLAEHLKTLEAMPSVLPQLEEAVKSGGLVEIPVAELLAYTPETGLGQELMQHLKVDPEGMSAKEAETFLQSHAESFQAEVQKVMADGQLADEFQASAEKVREGIKGQLDTVNRFTTDVNDAYASFVGSFYATQAARLGLTPEQLFEQHPLSIQATGVTEGSLMNQAASPKANMPNPTAVDELGPHEQADLITALYTELGGSSFGDAYQAEHGDVPMDEDTRGALFGLADPPLVQRARIPVSEIEMAQDRRTSDAVVADYAQRETEPPAVIVRRKPGGGYSLVEGGHRMRAAHASGRQAIDAIDATDLLDMDWARYLAGETTPDMPLRSNHPVQDELHQTGAHFSYDPGLGFHSTLFNTVLEKGQGKASADQWLAMLRNAPGVKKEELEWIGLEEGLKLMGLEGAVTKEQVLAFIAQNGVRLEEVVQGGKSATISDAEIDERMHALLDEDRPDFEDDYDGEAEEQWFNDNSGYYRDQAESELEREQVNEAQYADYQAIKGGENYREVLFILPNAPRAFSASMGHWSHDNVLAHTRLADFTTPDGKRALGVLEIQSDWHQKGRDRGYSQPATQEQQDAAADAWDAARTERNDLGDRLLDALEPLLRDRIAELEKTRNEGRNSVEKLTADYDAAWVEINAATEAKDAAARGNAYTRAAKIAEQRDEINRKAEHAAGYVNEAKRFYSVLFFAPVEGQQHGDPVSRSESSYGNAQRIAGNSQLWAGTELVEAYGEVFQLKEDYAAAALKAREAEQRVHQAAGNSGIPDAPFKATWPALAMKRIIRRAVEGNYDKVVWATGEQTADLYDMRAQVGRIMIKPAREGALGPYEVRLKHDIAQTLIESGHAENEDESYGGGFRSVFMTPEKIREVFGADLGGRMLAQADATPMVEDVISRDENGVLSATYTHDYAELSGDDLMVGGEGHKAFYNRNLVNITNDIIKKLGAKVGVHQISAEVSTEDMDQALGDSPEWGAAQEKVAAAYHAMQAAEPHQKAEAHQRWLDAQNAAEAIEKQIEAGLGPKQWGFDVTDKMRETDKLALFQASDQAPRGSFNPQTNTITLLRNADLSTFLHETGHFFLETLAKMAADEHAPAAIKDDWQKAAQFIGFGGADPAAWLSIPVDGRREGHETWARGFEAYLREGRAPASQLKGVFQRFKAWLVHVYQNMAQLNVELTDEVRGVFDRLLAAEGDIARAEAARSFTPIFDTKPEGMSDLEWEAYQRLGEEATADAQDQLQSRSIRDMRWLQNTRARLIREMARSAREARKALRAEVEAQVYAEPVYAAQHFLKRGVLKGEPVDGPHKLKQADVAAMYDGQPAELQDWKRLGYGKYGMLADDGLPADMVAELFGFSSGHELVEALLNAEPIQSVIEGVTDQRMMERYGDLHDQASIERAADEAIHNEARLRFVATEANALAKAVGKTRILAEAARDYARQLIGGLRVRDVKPAKYLGAETRAAVASAQAAAKGDLEEAATQKRNQLLNAYAAKAAIQAQKEVEAALRYLARFESTATRKGMDPDYRDQIDALLERFDLRKGQSLKAIDKRKSLKSWIEAMQARGLDPVLDDDLVNEAYRKHYRDLTVDELRGLVDAVKNIAHLGRLKNRLLVAAQGRAFQAVVDESEQAIRENAYRTVPEKLEHNQVQDRLLSGFANYRAIHRKFASIIREMSGAQNFDRAGILWRAFVQPLNRANDKEAAMREAATVRLAAIFKTVAGTKAQRDALRRKLFIPAIGRSLTLEGRLAVALNWGNSINRARIMDGDKWSADQAEAILQTLTAEQLQFVNQVHEYIDSFWPEVAAKERRVSGVAEEKVEAEPYQVQSADGQLVEMRGGYYPIDYDTERSSRSEADAAAEAAAMALRGARTRATTRRGHTKARVDKVERPVRKDLLVVFGHVNQVIHDLAFHEYLIDANRLLAAPQIDAAIRDHYGVEVLRTLKQTMKDIAEGDAPAANSLERTVNYIRTGTTIAGLGWSLTTGLLQPLGLSQSIVRIGPKYVAKGIARWAGDAFTLQNTMAEITGKSEFMRLRTKTMMREVSEVQNQVKSSAKPAVWGPVEGSFFYLIGKLQLVADIPTWLGAYAKAQDQGLDDEAAVGMADQAVRDSQGGGQLSDLAQIQRGSVWQKLWTNFYSFFNVGYNQLAEASAETRRVGQARLPLLAAEFLLVAIVPSVMGELLKRALRGDDWDWDELAPSLAKQQLQYLLGFMVGARELGAAVDLGMAFAGVKPSSGNDKGPAALRLLTSDLPQLATQVSQGEWDDALRRALINNSGILLHLPAGQINRTIDGFEAMAKGETMNPMALALGPPRKAK